MKKQAYSYLFLLCVPVLFSCSAIRKDSYANSNSAQGNSPRFLNGISVKPGGVVAAKEKSFGYQEDGDNWISNSAREQNNISYTAGPLQTKYGALLGVPPTAVTDRSLITEIDSWYGVPYQLGGNSKSGIDCSAFTQTVFNDVFNTSLPRTAQEQYDQCRRVDKDNLKEGDLVFFHTTRGSQITHVGVYLQNNKFVHASNSGVMISDLNENYWKRAYKGAGRPQNNGISYN